MDGNDWLEEGDLTPPVAISDTSRQRPTGPKIAVTDDDGDEDGIVLDNFTVASDHTVHGEAYNGSTVKKTMSLTATFYDTDRRILGTARGVVNELAPGQTKTFSLPTWDDVSAYQDFKVQIDAAF